jgi:tRNA-binding protein
VTEPRRSEIDAATFFTVDMRVGRVVEVEEFPEARKPAWKLTVDFGPEVGTLRTSAQITNYSREELAGRLVVGAVNLGTKRIAGFVSEFLVLGSITDDGTVLLLRPEDHAEPGQQIA